MTGYLPRMRACYALKIEETGRSYLTSLGEKQGVLKLFRRKSCFVCLTKQLRQRLDTAALTDQISYRLILFLRS